MKRKSIQIKSGIKLHLLNTSLFKTNIVAMFITVPMKKETVTRKCFNSSYFKMWQYDYANSRDYK